MANHVNWYWTGQLVSSDTDQSKDLTEVNKEANIQTWLRSSRSTACNEAALHDGGSSAES